MSIETILAGLGVNIASSVVYDFLKGKITATGANRTTVEAELQSYLRVHGINVAASAVIGAFASHGLLSIQGSTLYAPDQITMGAGSNARFVFGNNSTSRTDRSSIDAGQGAFIEGSNAAIVQNLDGSISFLVGEERKKH